MKKLVTAFAACAIAGALVAADSNIVGYNTVTLDKEWTIVGLNFEDCDGGAISLQEAVPYAVGMTLGATYTAADNIQIQNSVGGYDIYYMSNGKDAKGNTVSGLEGKWSVAGASAVADVMLEAGTAFWYLARTPDIDFKVVLAGQVLITDTADMPVTLATKHIANPFPTDLPLNDGIPYTVGMTVGATYTAADNIQIQNSVGGYDIYYMSNGKDAKGNTVSGLEGKWSAAGATAVTAAEIPIGKGAWYMRRDVTDFDITVVRPFSL